MNTVAHPYTSTPIHDGCTMGAFCMMDGYTMDAFCTMGAFYTMGTR